MTAIERIKAAIRRGQLRIKEIRYYNAIRRRRIKRLMLPTVMFDSVSLDQIPRSAPAIAGYTGGNWPTYAMLESLFPNAKRLSIAIQASEDADCLDVEVGDANPDQVVEWVRRQHKRGVKRPVVYTSVSAMDHIWELLRVAGIKRRRVLLWTAHYTFQPHICSPNTCAEIGTTSADATQWTDHSLGKNLDQSLLKRKFFER